jgi:predicted  nucleic acid-binding Zn-ribbon protein
MNDQISSIPSRTNDLEKDMHTAKHRLERLEELPPKVSELERALSGMDVDLKYIKQSSAETKTVLAELNNSHKTLSGELKGLSRALRLVAGLIAIGGTGVSIVLWFQ